MSAKRTYFGYSTPQQRKLLFGSWEATGSVTKACQKARLSRGLFYYWKPRFEQYGYAGLEEFESRAAHNLRRKSSEIERRVLEMREQNPEWGKARISDEMAKENNWVPVVSPNTVKRILKDADQWPERAEGKKNGQSGSPDG